MLLISCPFVVGFFLSSVYVVFVVCRFVSVGGNTAKHRHSKARKAEEPGAERESESFKLNEDEGYLFVPDANITISVLEEDICNPSSP